MICDKIRDKKEFLDFYNMYKLPNQYDWDFLCNNPNLFCFYDEEENGKLRGYITVQRETVISPLSNSPPKGENTYLTLSGASVRKNMSDNIDAILMVCKAFNEDMYSFTRVKPAKICLLRAGFKHIKDDMYIRRKENGQ